MTTPNRFIMSRFTYLIQTDGAHRHDSLPDLVTCNIVFVRISHILVLTLHLDERDVELVRGIVTLHVLLNFIVNGRTLLLEELAVRVIVFERNSMLLGDVIVKQLARGTDRVSSAVSHAHAMRH